MIGFAAATVFVLVAFGVLIWHAKQTRQPTEFVLGVLPAAVSFLVVPVPEATVAIIRTFQEIAETGVDSRVLAGAASESALVTSWWGGVGVMATMVVAFALRWLIRPGPLPEPVQSRESSWRTWLLGISPLLILPAAGVAYVLRDAVIRTVAASAVVGGGTVDSTIDVGQVSSAISARLILSVGGGLIVSALLLASLVGAIGLSRHAGTARALSRYSILIGVVVSVAAGAWLWQLSADIRRASGLNP